MPLDGQAAEAGAPSGALGAVIELSVAHKEVLDATSGDIDFRVLLGNANAAATVDSCPTDYRELEGVAVAGPAHAPAPAPAPGSAAPGARPAAAAVPLLATTLVCLLGALLL